MALLAAYNFDESSGDVLDVSGNGRHFPLNNNLVRTTGHTGNGVTKNGTGLPVIASPAFGQTTARTFMFWQQTTSDAIWWLRWYVAGADTGAWGLYNLGGTLTLRTRKGGANTNATAPMPGDGLWHHYAGTYDGTNARLYVDAVLVATSAAVTAPLDSAERIDMLEGSTPAFAFDDLRIYDEALDQPTIATLMNTPVSGEIPVEQASFAVPLTVDVDPAAVMPPATVPAATLAVPLTVAAEVGEQVVMPTDPGDTGGWRALVTINQWNRDALERERSTPPVACPQHGDPLQTRDGVRHCPMGHFV